MTPIAISESVQNMDDGRLSDRLNFLSFQFCVNADFTKEAAVKKLVERLEMNVVESLLRLFEDEMGYSPYQNKIYENVELVFDEQDAYNINRMMSSLRRAKVIPIDPTNEKYVKWMRNRIKYGVRTIVAKLQTIEEAQTA